MNGNKIIIRCYLVLPALFVWLVPFVAATEKLLEEAALVDET
jgi:hypothetical protein